MLRGVFQLILCLNRNCNQYHLKTPLKSWETGDEIAIGSTDFTQDHTEVFVLVECSECSSNQIKLDRTSKFHHWGRIDSRTGIDQRAPVGLLSRNVKIQGETGTECQYARTRWSLHKFHSDGTPNPTYREETKHCPYFQGIVFSKVLRIIFDRDSYLKLILIQQS